jgi:uncharacterized protein (DUF433 family)
LELVILLYLFACRNRRLDDGPYITAITAVTTRERGFRGTLDWSQCSVVESIPGKVSGAWVFKNTRMPVSLVFENLEAGATIENIMEWFHLTRGQIVAVLEFAARSLDAPPIAAQAGTSTLHADSV